MRNGREERGTGASDERGEIDTMGVRPATKGGHAMKYRKVQVVILPAAIFVATLVLLTVWNRTVWAGVLPVAYVSLLVLAAIFEKPEDELSIGNLVPNLAGNRLKNGNWGTLYERAIQMHIDTDKGMFQLITVFVGASLLILGWVVANPKPEALSSDHVLVVGSLAVVLVGIATLLKHRLRHYNKLREIYLRRLEQQLRQPDIGLHTFMKKATNPLKGLNVSFHEAIDIYYFIYLVVWIIVYIWAHGNHVTVHIIRASCFCII